MYHFDKYNKELFKNFAKTVIDMNLEHHIADKKEFSFGGKSTEISKKWREADAFTRTVFEELAAEGNERYKKVRLNECFNAMYIISLNILLCFHICRNCLTLISPSRKVYLHRYQYTRSTALLHMVRRMIERLRSVI